MPASEKDDHDGGFRHEALLYAGQDAFLAGALPFIRDGLAKQEPVLVMVGAAKIGELRAQLGADADAIEFADIGKVGSNPARILPVWRDFVLEQAAQDRPLRGIGEPIWAGRSPAELVECQRHESLLNLAFPGDDFRLLCPYDASALDPSVIDEARASHPFLVEDGTVADSDTYRGREAAAAPFADPLPDPPGEPRELSFKAGPLGALRRLVADDATEAGLPAARAKDLVLAVNEVATNSIRHGGGTGVLRVWQDDGSLITEVRDGGGVEQPLAGRLRPEQGQLGGHGLWLVNQVCDLVQVRAFATGGVVRMHMRCD
jgi:anti-sigma regulatory factor (Ser/Thr protein kinase)